MKEIAIFTPELPESIDHAIIIKWNKNIGDFISENEVIAEIETDKIVLEIPAPISGYLKEKLFQKNSKVKSQEILGYLSKKEIYPEEHVTDKNKNNIINQKNILNEKEKYFTSNLTPSKRRLISNKEEITKKTVSNQSKFNLNIKNNTINDKNIFPLKLNGNNFLNDTIKNNINQEDKTIVPMSPIRKKIAERLLFAQRNMVMLTTFNEVNMQCIINIRKKYQEKFLTKHQIKLGFMSFFVKAVTKALQEFPEINASIENQNIVYHNYYDINIAVSTPRGLITPILKNTNLITMHDIEKKIKIFSEKGKSGKLSLNDLNSGTFTISNGGVFGSLLSTPIINPPQVAILGMHAIQERPVVKNNIIKILPMMYLALSYDHQIIDGKQAIEFLNFIKDIIEDFSRISLNI